MDLSVFLVLFICAINNSMSSKLFSLLASLLVIGIVHSHCPDGWTTYGSSCYFFGHNDLSFMDAQRYCEHFHANLANIETSEENKFIESYLGDLKGHKTYTIACVNLDHDPKHWFGLTDELIEGMWKHYPSETTTHFLDWAPGQPEQGKSANCAAVLSSAGYHWVDEPCTNRFKPLCEQPVQNEVQVVG